MPGIKIVSVQRTVSLISPISHQRIFPCFMFHVSWVSWVSWVSVFRVYFDVNLRLFFVLYTVIKYILLLIILINMVAKTRIHHIFKSKLKVNLFYKNLSLIHITPFICQFNGHCIIFIFTIGSNSEKGDSSSIITYSSSQ